MPQGQRRRKTVKSIKILTPATMMPFVADQLAETFTLLKLPAPGPDRDKAITEWEQASKLAREAVPLQLEPSQVAWRLAMHLAAVPN